MKTPCITLSLILLTCVSGKNERNGICLSVPFKLVFNEILIQAQIDDSDPLWFILDSGASDFVINESTAVELKLPFGEIIDQGYTGIGENRVFERTLKEVCFKIKDTSFCLNKDIYAWPFKTIESIMGHRINGVFGRDLFEKYVVEIDHNRKIINLYDPELYQYEGNGKAIPIAIDGVPYAEATVVLPGKIKVPGYFMIDTGSAGALGFTSEFCRDNNLPAGLESSVKSIHSGGGGNSENRVGRIDAVIIGGYKIDNPLASISFDDRGGMARQDIAGIIGNGILKNFKVIFDYMNSRMILEKSESFNEAEEWDMSGLLLYSSGENLDQFYVYDVLTDSPAGKAGIRRGDRILSVDGITAETYSMDELSKMFRIEDREYSIGLLRGDEKTNVKVKMRKMI